MRPVECGVRPLGLEIAEVLRTTRRQHGGEEVRRAVVDRVAPGPTYLELQAFSETPSDLRLQSVVVGVAIRSKANDIGQVESLRGIHRIKAETTKGTCESLLKASQSCCQAIECRLTRSAGEVRQEMGGID